MKFELSKEPLSIFSFSSLTDIVLLLVIFFLLSSQFVIQTGVKVKLPGSKTNEQSQVSNLVVTLTAEGAIYAGAELTNIEELPAKLMLMVKSFTDDNLVIKADKTVAIDLLIKVIDAAKSSGIDKFTIQTEKENP
ncbi:MAG: biopolymer transporter ExbD [Ignavibacteriaceae bacterium]